MEHEKEIIKLHLELVRLRVEHQLCAWGDFLPKENVLHIVENEIKKEVESLDKSRYKNI